MADFGAGGGHYSKFFNDTGLVQAFAFDGIEGVDEVTKGAVSYWNLIDHSYMDKDNIPAEQHHWAWDKSFNYGLCLEVLEHIPKEYSAKVITTLARFVKKRLVMSWSNDREGIGHVHCQSEDEWVPFVESFGFKRNAELSDKMKAMASIEYITHSVNVFDRVELEG